MDSEVGVFYEGWGGPLAGSYAVVGFYVAGDWRVLGWVWWRCVLRERVEEGSSEEMYILRRQAIRDIQSF